MNQYTERHGMVKSLKKTYSMSRYMYALLFDCCEKYKKNLTHAFLL